MALEPELATPDPASFRDPMGFVFTRGAELYRQVNRAFAAEWDAFDKSPLQLDLISRGMLIPHEDVDLSLACTDEAYRVIRPTRIPFVTYPYEWSFGQLKDAALLTLRIQREALQRGYTLRDASAYNVQFVRGLPILIDSLSFMRHTTGEPWRAYRQFCEHFLGPLALMAYRDVRLRSATEMFPDGVPMDLTARLLPWSTRLRVGLGAHIFLHARAQRQGTRSQIHRSNTRPTPKVNLARLVESLEATVLQLRYEPQHTQWADYDERGSYSASALASKVGIIDSLFASRAASTVWDLGANAGRFSMIAASHGHAVVAIDGDPSAVEQMYQGARSTRENIHPLLVDLTNPTSSLGWASEERRSLTDRADAQVVMVLALLHHLVLAAGIPMSRVSKWLAQLAAEAIVEFVPPEDPKATPLRAVRGVEAQRYDRGVFVEAFAEDWRIEQEVPIQDSLRSIFTMRRRA